MSKPVDLTAYRTYRGLPALAGLATMAEAARPGLSIETCTTRLKRFHYVLLRLHEIFTARITAEPIYELKSGFALHGYLSAEHVAALRTRVGEMREPPLGLEEIPHPGLQVLFDEILAAPTTAELLVAVYEKTLPALDAALAAYMKATHPLGDAPSIRLCRFARLELADMLQFGAQSVASLVDAPTRQTMSTWLALLDQCLTAAGGVDGTQPSEAAVPAPHYSAKPFEYDPRPRRDERFKDLWNQGVNAEAFLYDEHFPARAKTLMMYFKRLREIDVPEMMASIIVQTKGKPWKYYRDLTRQLWDEARHAMLGEIGFAAQGVDWTRARITFNWSMRLNTECKPLERHAVLFYIEQGLMTRTGKRYEWEVAVDSGDPLATVFQDFDWADEVLHSQIGREWYVKEMGDLNKALAYGDECWSRILSNWSAVRDQGLTQHENWWPAIYEQACRTWDIAPDPQVLTYATTYEGQRADLKTVSG
ncbi:MAG: hypothetical protein U0840_07345 [Gemmataceae bacterium]